MMKQTPAHSIVNADLLALIPPNARRVVEVGCMHGAMARAYRATNPAAEYVGIDIDPDYAAVAASACTEALAGDIETFGGAAFDNLFPSDCWIFGDCLEHLRDPWRQVARIREAIDPDGCLLACIPNAQHWSLQMRLASGLFRYEDSGLMDRTHLRWFTRVTMMEMFLQAGWRIDHAISRQLPAQPPAGLMDAIRTLAAAGGVDPEQAAVDANAFQYVFRLKAN
ncbi:bifunctional 2-polyprenyl-6-hydroxyphenol methylase/3-demethylubiquinol 3-O-methyltransferase UbiG [Ideonella sp. A 288]|uniref:class I SAM-dependent methyltransferase n=1 Tax=Ideonella sp. A 288 TaxID=1962181 RepID=UPI000B4A93DF|nr:methyltransferase domain-containing protein [Ideonella sp. A 288]